MYLPQYFENWCQDENRHGDFFSAVLKAQPQFVNDFESKLWARFFCLSVYVTMYLNDHQRSAFYESLGLNTTQFNQHVIHETNRTTATIFPQARSRGRSIPIGPSNRPLRPKLRTPPLTPAPLCSAPAHLPRQVIDTHNPEFFKHMDALVELNNKLQAIKGSGPAETLQKLPILLPFVGHLLALFVMKPVDSGSIDITQDPAYVY